MIRNITLALAAMIILVLTSALVRVENERYALSIGMCRDSVMEIADFQCLQTVQTRTVWWWHVYYAITD